MAQPIYQTITAAGTYIFALDMWVNPFNVSWDVNVPGGTTVSYTVNGTLDPITQTVGTGYGIVVAANPTWDQVVETTATATKSGTITQPMQALQVVVASISGGPINVKIVQPFSIN